MTGPAITRVEKGEAETHRITSGGLETTFDGRSSSSQSSVYAIVSTDGFSEVSEPAEGRQQLASILRLIRGIAESRSVA
jgi:hypothetical protein